ncbi:GNAT family N-acetyltransferase [Streptomyces sp. NPDC056452]|uniref:GNAT family N-acetyltransferase n=1 Tax=Streptomyces sp. NPDC056452 TaxID=3345821 RepID=UPI003686AA7A
MKALLVRSRNTGSDGEVRCQWLLGSSPHALPPAPLRPGHHRAGNRPRPAPGSHQLLDRRLQRRRRGRFPFPPIDEREAAPALENILESLDPRTSRLLMALDDDELVGWLSIRRDAYALIAHWGTLNHVQTHISRRGQGIGSALTKQAHRIAREDMGLE